MNEQYVKIPVSLLNEIVIKGLQEDLSCIDLCIKTSKQQLLDENITVKWKTICEQDIEDCLENRKHIVAVLNYYGEEYPEYKD